MFTLNIRFQHRPSNRPRYPLGVILEESKWAYMGETLIEGHLSASEPCLFIDNFPRRAQGYFTLMRAAVPFQAKVVLEKVEEFAGRRVQLNTREDDKLSPNLIAASGDEDNARWAVRVTSIPSHVTVPIILFGAIHHALDLGDGTVRISL